MKNTLMLRLFICLIIAACLGCGNGNANANVKEDVGWGTNLVTVDSCEYVLYIKSNACALVHHGNCHNPAHQKK